MINLLDFRSIRFSERAASGFINLQPDYYGTAAGGTAQEAAFPGGLWGRPLDPDPDPDATSEGTGCNALYLARGSNGRMLPLHDPRYLPLLPDPGKGGWGLHAQVKDGAAKLVPYLRFVGEGGGRAPGTFELKVPYAGGAKAHLLEVDLDAGRFRFTHGDLGTYLEVTEAMVTLGGPAGGPLVTDKGGQLSTFIAAVIAALASLGRTVAPPVGIVATKAEAL